MPIKILFCSIVILFSLCSVSESNQSCEGDYIKLSFMGGRLGKVSIIYDRNGTVTFGPENGKILETKQMDLKRIRSYWLLAEDATKKVKPGKYGVIESVAKKDTDIKIKICTQVYSYIAVSKGKTPQYSEELANILEKRP